MKFLIENNILARNELYVSVSVLQKVSVLYFIGRWDANAVVCEKSLFLSFLSISWYGGSFLIRGFVWTAFFCVKTVANKKIIKKGNILCYVIILIMKNSCETIIWRWVMIHNENFQSNQSLWKVFIDSPWLKLPKASFDVWSGDCI